MEIHFLINEQSVNNMTWEEYETFERAQEGDVKLYRLRPILARFMLNGDGFMEHKKAMDVLAKIPVGKIKETVSAFMETVKGSAVPPTKGSESKSPSEATAADSLSPAG